MGETGVTGPLGYGVRQVVTISGVATDIISITTGLYDRVFLTPVDGGIAFIIDSSGNNAGDVLWLCNISDTYDADVSGNFTVDSSEMSSILLDMRRAAMFTYVNDRWWGNFL
jgi:hypothetical protein